MWEIFDPRNGEPVRETRFQSIARFICWRNKGLDYAKKGEGWITQKRPQLYSEEVPARMGDQGPAYMVHFRTPFRSGAQRFGGNGARARATNFAVEILQELLDSEPLEGILSQ